MHNYLNVYKLMADVELLMLYSNTRNNFTEQTDD